MNDPHVESLTYNLETGGDVTFDAPAVSSQEGTLETLLEDDVLTVELNIHFATIEDARGHVEKYLRAWEVKSRIERKIEITFEFEEAEVVDRSPTESRGEGGPGRKTIEAGTIEISIEDHVDFHTTSKQYPEPPSRFRLSPNARMLWRRYNGYEEGREPLFSMAYACLAALEGWAEGRAEAADMYNTDKEVLDTLGELSTTTGSPENARKPKDRERDATSEERQWIEEAIRNLILQVGICEAGHEADALTMDDLPDLP